MKAYSMDLRERIVQAVLAGMPQAMAARVFGVGQATVERYLRRHRQGDLAPRQSPGRPAEIGVEQTPELVAQLEAAPDATLAEHVATWAEATGVRVSVTTMHRTIRRVGWTRKKRVSTPASKTR
jgi:transposase